MAAGGDPDRSHILRPPPIGASPPWLPPPLIHDAERWNAALCRGEPGGAGGRWARVGGLGSARTCDSAPTWSIGRLSPNRSGS